MKKILLIFVFTAFIFSSSRSHPWKPDHYVIIDTDCGLDDFRAIRLMLESTNIRILAITTSNGVVHAKDGYVKIKNLLYTNHHEGILVGANLNSRPKATGCKSAYDFSWGKIKSNNTSEIISHTQVLNQVLKNSDEKIIFINMGSLNTITSYFIAFPNFKEKIKEVLWTCDYNLFKDCFNYNIDSSSFQSFTDLNLPLSIINNGKINNYSDQVIENIRTYNTALSSEILKSLTLKDNAFLRNLYDETTFLYLIKPKMFTQKMEENFVALALQNDYQSFEYVMDSVFKSQMINSQIFSIFPEQKSAYVEDVSEIMVETIQKYGKDEWASCVLTCEIHRHVGVYTLIGAKMGVRAREYFGAGLDELRIISYAGLEPPFSCLNDGLQVSTGATLGHGLISVKGNSKEPKADFYYLGQKITISLKNEYKTEVASKIKDLSYIYGLDSDIYWDLVRDIAINCWKNWNRHEIFEIKK